MKLTICDNDPKIKVVIDGQEKFEEDEAVICVGMYSGNFPTPIWKSIRFTTKDLKADTFSAELIEIVKLMLCCSAKQHGWTIWD